MHVPWEYLYDDPGFLSISTWTPVVRYLDLPRGRRPLVVTGPLQILAVVSGPSDVVELDTGREQATLEQALSELTAKGALEIHWLQSATLQDAIVLEFGITTSEDQSFSGEVFASA